MATYLGPFCDQEEDAMQEPVNATIIEHFSSLKDPRIQAKTRHKLIDIGRGPSNLRFDDGRLG